MVTNGRFAAFSQTGQGFGPAAAQQYDASGGPVLNQFTAAASTPSVLALWGTGLGPLASGPDADAPPAATIRNDIAVYVEGIAAAPLYAGRAPGLPGVDQINFALPAGVTPRCFVPLQIVTGGVPSGFDTIAVSAGSSTCNSEFGLSPAALFRLEAGGVAQGAILRMTSTTNQAGGVGQTADAWTAQYDAGYLSVLALEAHQAPVTGAAVCSENPLDRSYGQNSSAGVLPAIAGAPGCNWTFLINTNRLEGVPPQGCTASSHTFGGQGFTASGTVPPPRDASALTNLSAQRSGQGLTVAWSANPSPGDVANLR
jgi:hypothetical protein